MNVTEVLAPLAPALKRSGAAHPLDPATHYTPIGISLLSSNSRLKVTMKRELHLKSILFSIFFTAFVAVVTQPVYADALKLASPSIHDGEPISAVFSCAGADGSPALSWSGAPGATKSFALIVEDPDAPGGTFYHWVAYDLPPTATGMPANVARTSALAGGGRQGINGFGRFGYNGPCPPPGRVHHYHFRLFALDTMLDLGRHADAAALKSALAGHVLATAELVGTFRR
jgi:Raf kinase inhibitor-like YbhB/YbcL family protein